MCQEARGKYESLKGLGGFLEGLHLGYKSIWSISFYSVLWTIFDLKFLQHES